MQHTYSLWGSPLHLVLEEEVAGGYNKVADEFSEGQRRFKEKYGVNWTPDDRLEMNVTQEDLKHYHALVDLINQLIEINGGGLDIPEEVCIHNGLVKL